jgi:hypothetical protein
LASTPAHITGRTAGLEYLLKSPMGGIIRHIPAVNELHCLNCQPPGVVTECPTDADKEVFIEQHRECRVNQQPTTYAKAVGWCPACRRVLGNHSSNCPEKEQR